MKDIAARIIVAQLKELRRLSPFMNINTALCFLLTAQEEGLSFTDVRKHLPGIAQSSVSREINILGDGEPNNTDQAMGLLEVQISKQERRRKEIRLSARGRELKDHLTRIALDELKAATAAL